MKQVLFFILIISFFVFRPYQLRNTGMLYSGDDFVYLAHSTSIVFGEFPSYEKEKFIQQGTKLFHPIGGSILAVPFVFMFSQIDRLFGSDIQIERRSDNVVNSWTLFGFFFASVFYFSLGCFLLFLAARKFVKNEKVISWAILLMILFQGIPLFALRRPVFSHIYEFFVQSLLVFLLVSLNAQRLFQKKNLLSAVFVLGSIGMLTLIRPNDFFYSAMWLLIFFIYNYAPNKKGGAYRLILSSILMLGIFVYVFLLFAVDLNSFFGENAKIVKTLLGFKIGLQKLDNLRYLIFGIDWGLIFISPFIFFAIFSVFRNKFPLRNKWILSMLPSFSIVYILMLFRGGGSWYGARYFLPAFLPLCVYPFSIFLDKVAKSKKYYILVIIGILSIFPLFSMLCFEGNDTNLTLYTTVETGGWKNFFFQLELWKTFFTQPIEFMKAVFKGGLVYVVYLFSLIFNFTNKLPTVILDKYGAVFDSMLFIRVLLIYCCPILVYTFIKLFKINLNLEIEEKL